MSTLRHLCVMPALFVLLSLHCQAAKIVEGPDTVTAASAFLEMPRQDIDLLTRSMRQDMIDYMEQRDSVYKKANVYMGLSWIETMRPDYMRVHLSDVSSLQIKLLNQGKGKLPLVLTIYTIDDGNGTADSTIKFFNNEMQQLPQSKFMSVPDPKDFYILPKDSPISAKEIEAVMPFYTVEVTVDPATGNLTGRLTSDNNLTQEEAERLRPYLRKQLHWIWTGKKMQLTP